VHPPVVIDGHQVTSREPDDLDPFSQAMLGAVR
jgi:putative intracellular protease/amidase